MELSDVSMLGKFKKLNLSHCYYIKDVNVLVKLSRIKYISLLRNKRCKYVR